MRVQSGWSPGATGICVFSADGCPSRVPHSQAGQVSAGCERGTLTSLPHKTLHRPKYIYDVTTGSPRAFDLRQS